MNKTTWVGFAVLLTVLLSCKSQNKVNNLGYMQNIEDIIAESAAGNNQNFLQPGDQLVIMVTAKDMDVVKPFNQNYSTGEITQSSISNSNMPMLGQTTIAGPTYIVDAANKIDFPVLGQLSVEGKTITDFQQELRDKISRYVKNPSVNIRLSNYKVTVLGEVARPGQFVISDGHATVLNALGLAGDLTIYGKRDDILVVRNENGQITKGRINMLRADFINSPYFNLQQGDVVYVSPNETKEKTARLDPNMPIYISVAGIVVTILALVFRK